MKTKIKESEQKQKKKKKKKRKKVNLGQNSEIIKSEPKIVTIKHEESDDTAYFRDEFQAEKKILLSAEPEASF